MNGIKFLFLSVVLLFFSACFKKSDWNCTCDYNSTFYGSGSKTYTITQQTQPNANSKCGDYGKALINGNGSYTCKTSMIK